MRIDAYWLGIAGGVTILGVVVEMVRRRFLRGRFALIWLALGIVTIGLALAPPILRDISQMVGVQIPLNLLFFLGFLAMIIIAMQLSSEVGRLEERTRVLAEEVALLRNDLQDEKNMRGARVEHLGSSSLPSMLSSVPERDLPRQMHPMSTMNR